MKTVILGCHTIRDELEKTAREVGCCFPIRWVESGLHRAPDSLRLRLQEELDKMEGVDRVLLAFGYCGHSVLGLRTGDFELVLPRVDDCITLLIGSAERRKDFSRDGGVYFLTRGWLEGEFNIWQEYQATREKYGADRTRRVYDRILAHYKYLGLIDTGAYDLAALLPDVSRIAETLRLESKVFPGSTGYLSRFFTGPWSEPDFLVVPPRSAINLDHLGLGAASPAGASLQP